MLSTRAKLLVLTAACSVSVEALAAGLGEIRWSSTLNQPLDAEIEVVFADPRNLPEYSVAVVPNAAYTLSSGQMSAIVSDLQSEIIELRRRVFIRVRSRGPVREPFLSFKVALATSNARLLRNYTILLDPPFYAPEPSAAPAPQKAIGHETPTRVVEPAPRANVTRWLPDRSDRLDVATRQFGPTQRGDTLWAIARQVRRDRSIGISAVVAALHGANPHAFIGGDPNMLKTGVSLAVPDGTVGSVAVAPVASDAEPVAPAIGSAASAWDGAIDYRFTVVEHSSDWAYAAPSEFWSERDIAAARSSASATLIGVQIKPSQIIGPNKVVGPGSLPPITAAPEPQAEDVVSEPVSIAAASTVAPQVAAKWNWAPWLAGTVVGALFLVYILRTHRRQQLLEEELEAFRRREHKRHQRRTSPLREAARSERTPTFESSRIEEKAPSPAAPAAATAEASEPETSPPAPKVIVRPEEDAYTAGIVGPDLEEETIVAADVSAAPTTAASEAEEDLYNEIDLYIAYGRYEKAKDLIQSALEETPARQELRVRLAEVYYRTNQPEKFTQLAEELQAVLEPALWAKVETMAESLLKDTKTQPAGETADERTQLIEDDLPQPDIGSLTDELEKMGISELPFGDANEETGEVDYSKFESARFLK